MQCENVVTIYDYDKDDKTRFLVMELLQGRTLATHLAQHDGRLPRKEALRIIRSIREGLALAHSKCLVHTNLSPASVFYKTDGIARVFDFGIGELIPATQKPSVYASPEAGAADKSGDIFSAAVIAYELLSGRHPFAGEPATTGSSAPARIFSLMPGTWRALAQALALTPYERTASLQEFLSGLPKP